MWSVKIFWKLFVSGLIGGEITDKDGASTSKKRVAQENTREIGRGEVGTLNNFIIFGAKKLDNFSFGANTIIAIENFNHFWLLF